MRTKFFLCFALGLSCILAGCSTGRQAQGANGSASVMAETGVKLPMRFADYHELYAFIDRYTAAEGLPADENSIFKLAADSSTEILALENKVLPYIYVVESHYYDGGIIDQIRGAQGNGNYFILRPLATNYTELDTDKGFELIGIAQGNSCRLAYVNGVPRLITHWHISAAESPETIYEWNGKIFQQIE